MPGKDEGKDWATLSTANLTDHMLKFNQQNTEALLKEIEKIKITDFDDQQMLRGIMPTIQRIVLYVTSNSKTSKRLVLYFNLLMEEVMDDVEVYYPPLARELYKRVIQAINLSLWGAGTMKETAFLKVIISALSRINVADEKIVIPDALLEQMKELEEKS